MSYLLGLPTNFRAIVLRWIKLKHVGVPIDLFPTIVMRSYKTVYIIFISAFLSALSRFQIGRKIVTFHAPANRLEIF